MREIEFETTFKNQKYHVCAWAEMRALPGNEIAINNFELHCYLYESGDLVPAPYEIELLAENKLVSEYLSEPCYLTVAKAHAESML